MMTIRRKFSLQVSQRLYLVIHKLKHKLEQRWQAETSVTLPEHSNRKMDLRYRENLVQWRLIYFSCLNRHLICNLCKLQEMIQITKPGAQLFTSVFQMWVKSLPLQPEAGEGVRHRDFHHVSIVLLLLDSKSEHLWIILSAQGPLQLICAHSSQIYVLRRNHGMPQTCLREVSLPCSSLHKIHAKSIFDCTCPALVKLYG